MDSNIQRKLKKLLPWWMIAFLDIFAIGAALCVFALFHHAMPRYGGGPLKNIVTAEPAATPASAATPEPKEIDQTFTPAPVGDFSAVFPDYDTGAGKEQSYQSDNVRIYIDSVQENGAAYYVADIWVKNIALLRTAFAQDLYGQGLNDSVKNMADQNNAILAVSGDYYGARSKGIVIRNGNLYRDTAFSDVCVLYIDGTMCTYSKKEFELDEAVSNKAFQAWSFGPALLENGQAIVDFESSVNRDNPRCAIGYYEPGHYCFVLVDGRQEGYSEGMSLNELSELFFKLGCKTAYNLDGGQTAIMYFLGKTVNKPYNGGRHSSDIIYIGE